MRRSVSCDPTMTYDDNKELDDKSSSDLLSNSLLATPYDL